MDVELRAVTDGEFEALLRVDHAASGSTAPDAEDIATYRKATELDRTRAVFEGGRLVAASAALSLELTLPGLTTVPATGVTFVGVLPTHRRRGHLRRMMASLLDDGVARQEPVAILLASESLLYGRFGYGLASSHTSTEIESRHAALRPSAPDGGGRIELFESEHAAKVLPGLLDRARRLQPGDVRRPDAWWDARFRDPEKDRDGASQQFYAVHESASGEADGYATYRVKSDWQSGLHKSRVLLFEVVGLTPEAEADLWRFVFSLDLTEVVEADRRPLDDPLRWMLVDPRRLRVTMVGDFLWVRMLDVAAALSARRYPVEGTLVFEVTDAFRPGTAGRYRLHGGTDGAECRRTTDEPDLAVGVEDLGALYLGGVAASALAAAGRIAEARPGALRRADAMLASHPRPFSRTGF
ncbi:MAG: GNAT family N-acetyltransferase [Acidimicrobiales bacterium]